MHAQSYIRRQEVSNSVCSLIMLTYIILKQLYKEDNLRTALQWDSKTAERAIRSRYTKNMLEYLFRDISKVFSFPAQANNLIISDQNYQTCLISY